MIFPDTISPSTDIVDFIVASSPTLENCSFITRFSKEGLISYEGAKVAGGAIGVQIKSLMLGLVKSQNLVFSVEPIVTTASKVTSIFGVFDKGHKSKD